MGSVRAKASPVSMASSTIRWNLSPTFRRALVSQVRIPAFFRAFSVFSASTPKVSRRSWISARPPCCASRSSACHAPGMAAAADRAASASICRDQTSRSPYHSPVGRMVFTASNTVQKYRPRIHRARSIPALSNTGSGSSTLRMAFTPGSLGSGDRARIRPSLSLLPRPKGTTTRTPGTAAAASDSGTR